MITPQEALQRTIEHREIFHDEMLHLMRLIMKGEISPLMVAAITTGLRVKKETIGEITAAAQVMRELSTKVPVADKHEPGRHRGHGRRWFATPSTSAPAPCLWPPRPAPRSAKHGGRGVSSKSGSADVMEALGVNINLSPAAIAKAWPKPASASCLRPTTTRR
jgi:anthranilate phosphoribosyltransferase